MTASTPSNPEVCTRRTIVFSVHVPVMRPKVEILRGLRGLAMSYTRTPCAGQSLWPRWLER